MYDRLQKQCLPIIGMCSDVLGTFSATISKNTVKASKTDIQRDIFSPASGGRQNTIITKTDNSVQGNIIFIT